MTQTRTALVVTGAVNSACTRTLAAVTLPRLPWEPDITGPDPRHETAPGLRSIRNDALNERIGPLAPMKAARLARHWATGERVVEREVR